MKTMNSLIALIACFATISSSPALAKACNPQSSSKACLNKTCASLGQSMMDMDQKNILVCLKNDSSPAQLVWKSQSAGSNGNSCNYAAAHSYSIARAPIKKVGNNQIISTSCTAAIYEVINGVKSAVIKGKYSITSNRHLIISGIVLAQCLNGSIVPIGQACTSTHNGMGR